jgi:glycosyltransferase involved in cell wall biosynthesis
MELDSLGSKDTDAANPRISIVIPVYNAENYLNECIDSILIQTLKCIEIICIDDCSTDFSLRILQRYASSDKRISVICHNKNMGLASARNTGLDASTGKYVFFLDSDDFLAEKNALEILYNAAIKDRADEVVGGIIKWREDNNEKYLDWHKNYLSKEVRSKPFKKIPQLSSNVIAVNKLIKRKLLNENGIRFNQRLRKYEDNPFSCKIHIMADRISIIPKTTYIYRQQQSGTLTTTENKEDAFYKCLYCNDIFEFIEKDETRHTFRRIYYPMYTRQLISSATILEHFKPTEKEIKELMLQWRRIVNLMPKNFPAVPPPQKSVFKQLMRWNFTQAWNNALHITKVDASIPNIGYKLCGPLNHENIRQQILKQQKINSLLTSQIDAVYSSRSWRITGFLRLFIAAIRGYN